MSIDSFLIAHGFALILPLAIIEGPIVSVLTGWLAAQGYFDWYWAFLVLVCGDVIGDLLYYSLGRGSVAPLRNLGRRMGLSARVTPALQHALIANAPKMLCIGKWTHSIGFLVLIGSGMLRVPVMAFFVVNLLASLPKTALLFAFGYFAKAYYPLFEQHVLLGTVILGAAGLAGVLLVLRRGESAVAGGAGQ